jgi:hypothetical protein
MEQYNAKDVIHDFWGDGNVKPLVTKISDFVIYCPNEEMFFAAKVLPMAVSIDELNSYIAQVSSSILLRGAPKLPVVIIKVNEVTGEAELGVVLYYQYGTPTIEKRIRFMPMNEENRGRLMDELKTADSVIRFLEIANCKVIKTIHMPVIQNGHEYRARLVYARDLSLSYRMKSHGEMTDVDRFEYILKGIPEDDYPMDKLDEGMLESTKKQGYVNAFMESHLLLFSSELRDLKRVYDRPSEIVNFIIIPDMASCPALPNGFSLTSFNVDMYIDNGEETVFHDHYFSMEISLDCVDAYYDFVDGLKTLVPIKKYIGLY